MKFSTRSERNLTSEQMFAAISDFDLIAQILRQRGAVVKRVGDPAVTDIGSGWEIGFDWRGRHREMALHVTGFECPEQLRMEGQSDAFDITIIQTVVALSRERSRLIFELEVKPRNMRSRLLLQTAKLGKSQLDNRFERAIKKMVWRLTLDKA